MTQKAALPTAKIVGYMFSPKAYTLIQKSAQTNPGLAQFKNKPVNTIYNFKVSLSEPAKLDSQLKLSSQIQMPTSFSLTAADRKSDYQFITYILARIVKVCGFNKLDDPEVLDVIYNGLLELIENAEKSLLEALAPEIIKRKLTKKDFLNKEIRSMLIEEARAKHKQAIVVFEYNDTRLNFYVITNIFTHIKIIQGLNGRTSEALAEGVSLADVYQEDNERIGAGLGLVMTKTIFEGLSKEHGFGCHLSPLRDARGHIIMRVEFTELK